MTNKEVVEEFYSQYFRSPSRNEFIQCGGDLRKVIDEYGGYNNFLTEHKYEIVHGNPERTYEVFDNDGNSIFVGTAKDIGEEIGCCAYNVRQACVRGHRIQRKYRIKEKFFKGHL